MNFAPYFDEQIRIQRQAILSFKVWVAALVVSGISIILLSVFVGSVYPAASSDLIKLGGGFVAVLSAFPGKEIFPRKETIAKYSWLRQSFSDYDQQSPDAKKRLDDLATDM